MGKWARPEARLEFNHWNGLLILWRPFTEGSGRPFWYDHQA